MYIPSAKSNLSLIILAVIALVLFYITDRSRHFLKDEHYDTKLKAAKLMEKAEGIIKDYRIKQNTFIDVVNDPNKTTLIGEKNTLITTDRGSLEDKLTSLNPNFAAVIVDKLIKADLKKGDKVAISMTSSMPALNIAVYAACQTLGVDVVAISSVGSSMFGATDPNFTWLDMEKLLNDKGVINYKSIAASYGGGSDIGRGLNIMGRELILKACERNSIPLIAETSLLDNIKAKMDIYNSKSLNYDLYINIGGGLSSVGNSVTAKLIKDGLYKNLSVKNLPVQGTMIQFSKSGTQILHLTDPTELAAQYKLPKTPEPLPKAGEGEVFVTEKYDMWTAGISLFIMISLVTIVILFDNSKLKLREDEIIAD